jgi:hypothetical protein
VPSHQQLSSPLTFALTSAPRSAALAQRPRSHHSPGPHPACRPASPTKLFLPRASRQGCQRGCAAPASAASPPDHRGPTKRRAARGGQLLCCPRLPCRVADPTTGGRSGEKMRVNADNRTTLSSSLPPSTSRSAPLHGSTSSPTQKPKSPSRGYEPNQKKKIPPACRLPASPSRALAFGVALSPRSSPPPASSRAPMS